MKKMPTLFVRTALGDHALATAVVTPGCEWVLAGEGTASRMRDGMAILVRDTHVYKRYDAKVRFATAGDREEGRIGVRDGLSEGYILKKQLPLGFEPCGDPDGVTGHWPGWVPAGVNDPIIDQAIVNSRCRYGDSLVPDGSYEVCGPSVGTRSGKNPEGLKFNIIFRHGSEPLPNSGRTFDAIKAYLARYSVEGIVWVHPDGRMAKIKTRDFGLEWPR